MVNGDPSSRKKVMAVASGGGHWVQLMRLSPVLQQHETTWITVQHTYREQVPLGQAFFTVVDATRWSRWDLLRMSLQILFRMVQVRPDVVITTGAAPGFAALVCGRLIGARTVWIDSIANAEQMSLSGQRAKRWADLWLTQWPHLAVKDGPQHLGSVL